MYFVSLRLPCCSATLSGVPKHFRRRRWERLKLNKKYIHESYVQDKDGNYSYYIFTSADEGEHHYYYAGIGSNSRIYSYTIYFRYKIVGEMAHCFFDSVEYGADDTEKAFRPIGRIRSAQTSISSCRRAELIISTKIISLRYRISTRTMQIHKIPLQHRARVL